MLNKEEELKLEYLTKILVESKKDGHMPRLGAYDFEWLVTKLKEVNDKLKKVDVGLSEVLAKEWSLHWNRNEVEDEEDEEVLDGEPRNPIQHCGRENCSTCDEAIIKRVVEEQPKMDQIQTDLISNVYKNPKNEISDRFYPR